MVSKTYKLLVFAFITFFTVSVASAEITVDLRNPEGDDIDSFDMTLSGEDTNIDRENTDNAELDLDEGEYDLEFTKSDFSDLSRTIFVEEDETSSYIFTVQPVSDSEEDESPVIEITELDAPESVCRGQSLTTEVRIENQGNTDEIVSTSGSGFGEILVGQSFVINAGESVRYRFIFTGVEGSGETSFSIDATNSDSDSINGTVDIQDCSVPGDPSTVEDIEFNIYPPNSENSRTAFVNEVVRVKGFADGGRGPIPLELEVDGDKVADITTGRDGYFEEFFRPEKSGELTVTVSAGEEFSSRTFEVAPTAEVSNLRLPEKTFSGEDFQVCGNVDSVIAPDVILLENGEILESRQSKGAVCFNVTAPEAGEYTYEMRALTYGKSDSAQAEIEVLEQGPEAESFPGQIATVESEPGILKVTLYNTNDNSTNYTARLDGLNEDWISDTEKTISLNKGERKSVFFYMSPKSEGDFSGILEVESRETIIYSNDVNLYSVDQGAVASKLEEFVDQFVSILFLIF